MSKHRRPISRCMAFLSAAIAASLAVACDWFPESFGPEYSNTATNYIEAYPIGAPSVTANAAGGTAVELPAVWDWAWRGKTSNAFEYMTIVDEGGVGADITAGAYTLPGSATAWRIELVNLAANPAFGAADISPWAVHGVATAVRTSTGAISGNSLRIQSPSKEDDRVSINGNFFSDIDLNEHIYQLSFNLLNAATFRYEEGAFFVLTSLQNPSWSLDKRYFLPLPQISGFSSSLSKNLFMVDENSSSFKIDDMHAIRTDVTTDRWSLALRLRAADTTPALVPGLYEFAVWVKKPDDCFFPTESGRGDSEAYASTSASIRIAHIGTDTMRTLAAGTYDIAELGSGWHRVALRMPATAPLSFAEGGGDQLLELSVSPGNPLAPEAGALLVSSPSLHYYINGF